MRITDLLDARSILLNASPKSKNEALDQIVDLMVKSEKINDKEAYRKAGICKRRRKYDQESEKESPFRMENAMR